MATNRGKQFENLLREQFSKYKDVSVDRIHDQTTGYMGSKNICDLIVYKYPYIHYFECKTVHGNTLPLSNITENQCKGLLEKSKINGVIAGVICWWVDLDETWFIPIWVIEDAIRRGEKSINIKHPYTQRYLVNIKGKKKRVFYNYSLGQFLDTLYERKRRTKWVE